MVCIDCPVGVTAIELLFSSARAVKEMIVCAWPKVEPTPFTVQLSAEVPVGVPEKLPVAVEKVIPPCVAEPETRVHVVVPVEPTSERFRVYGAPTYAGRGVGPMLTTPEVMHAFVVGQPCASASCVNR